MGGRGTKRASQPTVVGQETVQGEVAFNQVAAVPIPAVGLLLLGALGGLGLVRHRTFRPPSGQMPWTGEAKDARQRGALQMRAVGMPEHQTPGDLA